LFHPFKNQTAYFNNVEHFSGPQRSKGGASRINININCYYYTGKTGMKFAVTKIPLGPSSLRKPQLFREAQKLKNIYARALVGSWF
jgi:hypothetical protein